MEWISVEDRLPEVRVDVVWWCKFHDTVWIPVSGWINKNKAIITPTNQTEYKYGAEKRKVTYWMPLPEPPKERG